MKKQNYIVEDILSNVHSKDETKNYYVIQLTFDKSSFQKKLTSVSNFFKVLTNGKNNLGTLGTNRNWWSRVKGSGFYRIDTTPTSIEMVMYLESTTKINEIEFRYRVKRITPSVLINFTENSSEYIDDNHEKLIGESSLELFGKYKRSLQKN